MRSTPSWFESTITAPSRFGYTLFEARKPETSPP